MIIKFNMSDIDVNEDNRIDSDADFMMLAGVKNLENFVLTSGFNRPSPSAVCNMAVVLGCTISAMVDAVDGVDPYEVLQNLDAGLRDSKKMRQVRDSQNVVEQAKTIISK